MDKTLSSSQGHVMLMDPSYSQTSACPLPEGSTKGGSRKVKAIMNQLLSNLAPGG